MQFVYKHSLLKIIIGNCNNSNPHRGPMLDPTLSISLCLPSFSVSPFPPCSTPHHLPKGRITVNCSEFAPICSTMYLWNSANSTITCSKLNSIYLPIIRVSAADFVSALLKFISSTRWGPVSPGAIPADPKKKKGVQQGHPPFWAPGAEAPKLKNKMAASYLNSKIRCRWKMFCVSAFA